jgi:transmembrane sensor
MNAKDPANTVKCSREQTREAAVWMTLLRSPDRTEKMDRGLKRWLAAHPGNVAAFEAASTAWEAAGMLPRGPFPHHLAGRQGGVRRAIRPALAAAVLATLAVTGIWLQGRHAGVATDIGEQRILTLQDGTRVFLNTDTRVVVRYGERRRVVELKSGEAYFDVAKHGPGWPFVVTAGGQQVHAVGTAFVVRRDSNRLLVTLLEGKVTVALAQKGGAPIALSPGQRLTLEERQPPKVDEPVLEKVTAWRAGYLDLPVMPLEEAVAEMNRYSRTRIRIAESESAVIPISGVFRAGDNVSFANAVADAYGLEVQSGSGGITLRGKPKSP